jgi:hypothetical protein
MGILCACLMEQVEAQQAVLQQQGLSINPMLTFPLTTDGGDEGGQAAGDRGRQDGGGEGGEVMSP